VRRSLRAPVDNSPMLVKIVSSTVLAKGRRVHAVCLDISDSGCRASWPGRTPLVGDAVDVAWEVGDWQADDEPGWVSARVARIVALPSARARSGFTFEIADSDQAARVRAWHQAWLHEHRQRLLDQRAADSRSERAQLRQRRLDRGGPALGRRMRRAAQIRRPADRRAQSAPGSGRAPSGSAAV